MRKRIVAIVLVAVSVAMVTVGNVTTAARAEWGAPTLDGVASLFAQRPVVVKCHNRAEDSTMEWAWGYVFVPTGTAKFTVVHENACIGALAIATDDPIASDYMKAIGVVVLVHEAFHLRNVPGNENEAITECRAFQNYDHVFRALGASQGVMDRLMVYAILNHYRLIAAYPEYKRANCRLPVRYRPYIGRRE